MTEVTHPISRGLARPYFTAWLSMLALLLATDLLIPVARSPARHSSWIFEPIRDASLLAAVIGMMAIIAVYTVAARRFAVLGERGPIVVAAALLSGLGCAFVVFSVEHNLDTRRGTVQIPDYSALLATCGGVTAAIFIAFVIEHRFAPPR